MNFLAPTALGLAALAALRVRAAGRAASASASAEGGAEAPKTVLVTGGTGFIGSHIVLELLQAGYRVVVADNLCNSSREVIARVGEITGRGDRLRLAEVDLRSKRDVDALFASQPAPFSAVVHCAGLKAVGDSVREPLEYFENNVSGTVYLLRAMEASGCSNIVFSSSATVYGGEADSPIPETAPAGPGITNAYGLTKYHVEDMLRAVCASPKGAHWNCLILRYFNPVGAHASGHIGEDPNGVPNNLMPYIQQVCVGRRPHLSVFGDDYPTPDGTCVRDYVHVSDLAEGHVAAVRLAETAQGGCDVFNLGRGKGASVLELVAAMEVACGKPIPHEITPRRAGDVATLFASSAKAERVLGWKARRGIDEMCRDAWNWQSQNPQGFAR